MEIRDYPSRMDDPASRKFEAMSYLPQFTDDEIRKQLERVARMGWDCMIEHVSPARASDGYWHMWKLPLFGQRDVDEVLKEAAACAKANPGHHVRISAIDRYRQTMAFSLVTRRAKAA